MNQLYNFDEQRLLINIGCIIYNNPTQRATLAATGNSSTKSWRIQFRSMKSITKYDPHDGAEVLGTIIDSCFIGARLTC